MSLFIHGYSEDMKYIPLDFNFISLTSFSSKELPKRFNRVKSKWLKIELENICDDYVLTYYHSIEDSSGDHFVFKGIPPTEGVFPKILAESKSLEDILKSIRKIYPKMRPRDWNAYERLKEKVQESFKDIGFLAEENEYKQEKAIKNLNDFCKRHGLAEY